MAACESSSVDAGSASPVGGASTREARRRRQGLVVLAVAASALPAWYVGGSLGLLGWLALAAPALGALAGGFGAQLWPAAWIAPGLWSFLLIQSELASERPLERAGMALALVSGGFFLGLAGGIRARRRPERCAGLLLVTTLLLAVAPVLGGLADPSGSWARRSAGLGRILIDASPLVMALETAGLDWTHAQPVMYARGGVEWVERAPYRGALAGPVVLLVGSVLAAVAQGRERSRR